MYRPLGAIKFSQCFREDFGYPDVSKDNAPSAGTETPLLLIPLTAFFMAQFVYNIPVPVERVIIFPMAIMPNLFGVWKIGSTARGTISNQRQGSILGRFSRSSGTHFAYQVLENLGKNGDSD